MIAEDERKPPFDPLQTGWVYCEPCYGTGKVPYGAAIKDCPACDGLGIVVGPPADGVELVAWSTAWRPRTKFPFEHGVHMRWLVKQANTFTGKENCLCTRSSSL